MARHPRRVPGRAPRWSILSKERSDVDHAETSYSNPRPIEPGASIGHIHLKVSDLNRAIAFYGGVLGFDVMQRYGDEAAFLSAGGYHHHIGLNTWESKGGHPQSPARPAYTTLQFGTRREDRLRMLCVA